MNLFHNKSEIWIEMVRLLSPHIYHVKRHRDASYSVTVDFSKSSLKNLDQLVKFIEKAFKDVEFFNIISTSEGRKKATVTFRCDSYKGKVRVPSPIPFNHNDGGRKDAGYKGFTSDCVIRSISIVSGIPYKKVYRELQKRQKAWFGNSFHKQSVRKGTFQDVWGKYIKELGFERILPTRDGWRGDWESLPKGELLIHVNRHVSTVLNNVINDVWNPAARDILACYYLPNPDSVLIAADKPEPNSDMPVPPEFFEVISKEFRVKVRRQSARGRYTIWSKEDNRVALLSFIVATGDWRLTFYSRNGNKMSTIPLGKVVGSYDKDQLRKHLNRRRDIL